MNILYILGNGFDKAMGMATSYPEFYKYLKENVKNGSSLFNKMMSQITSDKADLIILFAVSLGETDAHWWKRIGANLLKKKICL